MRLKSLKTLEEFNCPPHIIEHSKRVSVKALDMAYNLMDNHGYALDLQIIETGAILHDIGRTKTHTIKHAIEGAKILSSLHFPKEIIDITRKHIGAGIPSKEAELLGLPPGDYMPNTLEEKIVAHADNLIMGTSEVDVGLVIEKWRKQFGYNHPSIYRIKNLHKELNP